MIGFTRDPSFTETKTPSRGSKPTGVPSPSLSFFPSTIIDLRFKIESIVVVHFTLVVEIHLRDERKSLKESGKW